MSETTQVAAVETTATAETATTAKSVAQRASRKRFSFGPVWNQSVIDGKATDVAKLVEQAIKLKCGARSDIKKLKLTTLRTKVAAKLQAEAAAPAAEASAEVAQA